MRLMPSFCLLVVGSALCGCLHVKTEPIEVKPIQVTVDVRIHVEKDLDSFFGSLDQNSATLQTR